MSFAEVRVTVRATSATPRHLRLIAAARLVRSAREEAGLTKADVAAIQNVNRNVVVRYEDEDDGRSIAPLDLALDPGPLGRAIVCRLAAAHGFELSAAPTDLDSTASDVLALATAAQQSSECVAAYAEAIADGSISASERDRVEREATEAIAALTALRSRVREVPACGASVRVLRRVEGS